MSFVKSNQGKARKRDSLIALLLCLCVVFMQGCGGDTGQSNAPQLVRAGSPDFDKYQPLIKIDEVEATESPRPVGDIVMTLYGTVRNFTGRTLNGLEVRASVVDLEGNPVKERTLIVIPTKKPELEHNQTMRAQALLEGISKNATRANIKMEVTGISLK